MLREFITEILKKYSEAKQGNYADNELARVIRTDLPEFLENITENGYLYKFQGSAGQGVWANCPYVAILDKNITNTVRSGYFPVYLFREDMQGVYLSLMFGTDDFKSKYHDKAKDELVSHATKCREKHPNLLNSFAETEIDLATDSPNSLASFYEAGNIVAQYYDISELPTEEELEEDYWEILSQYNKITSTKPEFLGMRDFIKKMLENYLEAKHNKTLAKELISLFANKKDFHKYLIEIADQTGNGNYILRGYFGSAEKLVQLPRLYIYDKNGLPFLIRFNFREDMKGVYLSLTDSTWNAERKMIKEGIKFKKFDDTFREYVKSRVSNARNKLKNLTKISDDLIEDINLNSVKATSASSLEAANIYAKYYALDTLPSEEELITDFKKFLMLYEKLLNNDFPKVNIKQSLETIFNELPSIIAKNEKVKGHHIRKEFLGISNSILKIANFLYPEKNYHAEGYYRHTDTWYKRPYIYIEDSAHKNKFSYWDQHFVGFWFTEGLNGVYLTLDQSKAYARGLLNDKLGEYDDGELKSYIQTHGAETRDLLIKTGNVSDELLEESSNAISWKDRVIFGRYYDKNSLPSNDKIISDFKELFELYSQLKPDRGITTVNTTFFEFLKEKEYFFDYKLVENFLLSLKVKPFVILTGNSGTGKTKVAQLFAQYLSNFEKNKDSSFVTEVKVGQSAKSGGWALNKDKFFEFYPELKENEITCDIKVGEVKGKGTLTPWPYLFFDKTEDNIKKMLEEVNPESKVNLEILIPRNNEPKYEIIPVGANWTENRHIVGFYNVITEKYQKTSSLNLILSAQADTDEPYFLILDEMNLSHVERYFSDLLSAMESEEEIELHNAVIDGDKLHEQNKLPPQKIRISPNLIVIGTVNVDETTYMFSPKVLDRANTLEFLTQPAEEYMSGSLEYSVNGDLDYLQNPLSDIDIRDENINELKDRLIGVKVVDGRDIWDVFSKNIGQFQEILRKANFDFGFRTINEIIRFMCVAWRYEENPVVWDNWERYFDAQIMQKMLPKLHGSQKELSGVLGELEDLCTNGNFPSAELKLKKMRKSLKEKRYVAFTG